MLDRVSVSVFEACLNQAFTARDAEGCTYALELFEARALEPRPGLAHLGIREDPFSLLFRVPAGTTLCQGCYTLEHPRFEAVTLFLVPISPPGGSARLVLQAVFG